ncbi:MAG: MbnP family protein [Bacteroidota bacterium]
MRQLFILTSFFLILANSVYAQTELTLLFSPTYKGSAVSLYGSAEEGIQIEAFKVYLSRFILWEEGELVYDEPNSFHLLDAEDPASLKFSLTLPEGLSYTNLSFSLGIDSLTSVSGVFGGDLDPTNGMYWSWQSGYINFKLEGTSPDCPARHNRFQYHIGGYNPPFNMLREVSLAVSSKGIIPIEIELDKFLGPIDLTSCYQIMSPSKQAMELADLLPTLFTIAD